MTGKTILHLPRGIIESDFFCSNSRMLKKKLILKSNNILSNGVNKILEKLGEARLLGTCIGEINEVTNG